MNTEEQVIENVEENNLDLEEDITPSEDISNLENALNDVVPCESIAVDSHSFDSSAIDYSSPSGLYNDAGYTPNTDINQMIDINKTIEVTPGKSSEYELEEAYIPNENNTPDDNQLDDIVIQ